jgi:hypothetical protein
MGDTTLELTRELAGTDLAAIAEGDQEIVTTLPWGLLAIPKASKCRSHSGRCLSQRSWCGCFGDAVR